MGWVMGAQRYLMDIDGYAGMECLIECGARLDTVTGRCYYAGETTERYRQ